MSTDAPNLSDSAAGAESRRDAALAYLLGRINYERIPSAPLGERQLKLDRMRTLLRRLGNPASAIPIIHVAGTKGKGSTSKFVESILREAGYDVGVYSSPHLERIEERFCVNGQECSGEELASLVDEIRPVVALMDKDADTPGDPTLRPTFFELTNAIALMLFARRRVDVIVLEVGLGGRLDSTNVCQPAVTAITSISLDHTKQLGDTVEKIAFEKGGIIKPGVPVLLGPLEPGPRQVLVDLATERGSPVIEAGRDFRFDYRPPATKSPHGATGRIDFRETSAGETIELADVPLGMPGAHQAANAALALAITIELRRQGWLVSTDAMRRGLAAARLPGRVEALGSRPTIVLDVAHNVASAAALVESLDESFAASRRILVFSASRDKDVVGILRTLLPEFDQIVLTEFQDNPRAVPVERLAELCREELQRLGRLVDESVVTTQGLPAGALGIARKSAAPDDLICVTGSFFLVAELRAAASGETPLP